MSSSYSPDPKNLIVEWCETLGGKSRQTLNVSELADSKSCKGIPVFCDWRIRRYRSLAEALAGDFIPTGEDLLSTGEDLQKTH